MPAEIYIKNYVIVNGLAVCGGTLMHFLSKNPFYVIAGIMILKNMLVTHFISSSKAHVPHTKSGVRSSERDYYYLIQTSVYESIAYIALSHLTLPQKNEILLFIPKSFLFEIVFDFFHYCAHRLSHSNSFLYKYHADHHRQLLLDPYKAFYQSPVDLFFSNFLPLLFTTYCISVSQLFLAIFFWYKTIIEVGGHIGKDMRATSFPQCMFLPRLLHIELRARDHEIHHLHPNKNFGKRFMLWDRVFGTAATHTN